ncbi:unnamed protein product [Owenia fusiformis]|uniref:EH domain-containing protein n=1 Tax=Owenia fusiformis TaxID=6347 RepID=A0A8S4MYK6_OWEFU|nr:unnamed protein product [Owenia fusiformis]
MSMESGDIMSHDYGGLSQEEQLRHAALFFFLGPYNDLLPGLVARDFLLTSNLPLRILSLVWNLTDVTNDNILSLREFTLTVHLCQRYLLGQQLPKSLPSNIVPCDRKLQYIPSMSEEDVAVYFKAFQIIDNQNSGVIEAATARNHLRCSGLSKEHLGEVWDIADIYREGTLTDQHWSIACHIIRYLKQGNSIDGAVDVMSLLPEKESPKLLHRKQWRLQELDSKKQDLIKSKEYIRSCHDKEEQRLTLLKSRIDTLTQQAEILEEARLDEELKELNTYIKTDLDNCHRTEQVIESLNTTYIQHRQSLSKLIIQEQKMRSGLQDLQNTANELKLKQGKSLNKSKALKDPDPFHELHELRKEEKRNSFAPLPPIVLDGIEIPGELNPFSMDRLYHDYITGESLFNNIDSEGPIPESSELAFLWQYIAETQLPCRAPLSGDEMFMEVQDGVEYTVPVFIEDLCRENTEMGLLKISLEETNRSLNLLKGQTVFRNSKSYNLSAPDEDTSKSGGSLAGTSHSKKQERRNKLLGKTGKKPSQLSIDDISAPIIQQSSPDVKSPIVQQSSPDVKSPIVQQSSPDVKSPVIQQSSPGVKSHVIQQSSGELKSDTNSNHQNGNARPLSPNRDSYVHKENNQSLKRQNSSPREAPPAPPKDIRKSRAPLSPPIQKANENIKDSIPSRKPSVKGLAPEPPIKSSRNSSQHNQTEELINQTENSLQANTLPRVSSPVKSLPPSEAPVQPVPPPKTKRRTKRSLSPKRTAPLPPAPSLPSGCKEPKTESSDTLNELIRSANQSVSSEPLPDPVQIQQTVNDPLKELSNSPDPVVTKETVEPIYSKVVKTPTAEPIKRPLRPSQELKQNSGEEPIVAAQAPIPPKRDRTKRRSKKLSNTQGNEVCDSGLYSNVIISRKEPEVVQVQEDTNLVCDNVNISKGDTSANPTDISANNDDSVKVKFSEETKLETISKAPVELAEPPAIEEDIRPIEPPSDFFLSDDSVTKKDPFVIPLVRASESVAVTGQPSNLQPLSDSEPPSDLEPVSDLGPPSDFFLSDETLPKRDPFIIPLVRASESVACTSPPPSVTPHTHTPIEDNNSVIDSSPPEPVPVTDIDDIQLDITDVENTFDDILTENNITITEENSKISVDDAADIDCADVESAFDEILADFDTEVENTVALDREPASHLLNLDLKSTFVDPSDIGSVSPREPPPLPESAPPPLTPPEEDPYPDIVPPVESTEITFIPIDTPEATFLAVPEVTSLALTEDTVHLPQVEDPDDLSWIATLAQAEQDGEFTREDVEEILEMEAERRKKSVDELRAEFFGIRNDAVKVSTPKLKSVENNNEITVKPVVIEDKTVSSIKSDVNTEKSVGEYDFIPPPLPYSDNMSKVTVVSIKRPDPPQKEKGYGLDSDYSEDSDISDNEEVFAATFTPGDTDKKKVKRGTNESSDSGIALISYKINENDRNTKDPSIYPLGDESEDGGITLISYNKSKSDDVSQTTKSIPPTVAPVPPKRASKLKKDEPAMIAAPPLPKTPPPDVIPSSMYSLPTSTSSSMEKMKDIANSSTSGEKMVYIKGSSSDKPKPLIEGFSSELDELELERRKLISENKMVNKKVTWGQGQLQGEDVGATAILKSPPPQQPDIVPRRKGEPINIGHLGNRTSASQKSWSERIQAVDDLDGNSVPKPRSKSQSAPTPTSQTPPTVPTQQGQKNEMSDDDDNVSKHSIANMNATRRMFEKMSVSKQIDMSKVPKRSISSGDYVPNYLRQDSNTTVPQNNDKELKIAQENQDRLKYEREAAKNELAKNELVIIAPEKRDKQKEIETYIELTEADRGQELRQHESLIDREIRAQLEREQEMKRQGTIPSTTQGRNKEKEQSDAEEQEKAKEKLAHESIIDIEIREQSQRERNLAEERGIKPSSKSAPPPLPTTTPPADPRAHVPQVKETVTVTKTTTVVESTPSTKAPLTRKASNDSLLSNTSSMSGGPQNQREYDAAKPILQGLVNSDPYVYKQTVTSEAPAGESYIARELREAKEREEEFKLALKARGVLVPEGVDDGSIIYSDQDVKHVQLNISNAPHRTSRQKSAEQSPSTKPRSDSRTSNLSSDGSQGSQLQQDTSPEVVVTETVTITESTPGKVQPLSPYEQQEYQYIPRNETVIEREIRLAKQRENAHRESRGLPINNQDEEKTKEIMIEVLSPTPQAPVRSKRDSVDNKAIRRYSTNLLQKEIEQANRREKDLRSGGLIRTTSEEHIGEPMKYVEIRDIESPTPKPKSNPSKLPPSIFETHESDSGISQKIISGKTTSRRTPEKQPSIQNGYNDKPASKVEVTTVKETIIADKAPITQTETVVTTETVVVEADKPVVNGGAIVVTEVPKPAPVVKRPSTKTEGMEARYQVRSANPAESIIEQELRAQREREAELREQRRVLKKDDAPNIDVDTSSITVVQNGTDNTETAPVRPERTKSSKRKSLLAAQWEAKIQSSN